MKHLVQGRVKAAVAFPSHVLGTTVSAVTFVVAEPICLLAAIPVGLVTGSKTKAIKCATWGLDDGREAALGLVGLVPAALAMVCPEFTTGVLRTDKLARFTLKHRDIPKGVDKINKSIDDMHKEGVALGIDKVEYDKDRCRIHKVKP